MPGCVRASSISGASAGATYRVVGGLRGAHDLGPKPSPITIQLGPSVPGLASLSLTPFAVTVVGLLCNGCRRGPVRWYPTREWKRPLGPSFYSVGLLLCWFIYPSWESCEEGSATTLRGKGKAPTESFPHEEISRSSIQGLTSHFLGQSASCWTACPAPRCCREMSALISPLPITVLHEQRLTLTFCASHLYENTFILAVKKTRFFRNWKCSLYVISITLRARCLFLWHWHFIENSRVTMGLLYQWDFCIISTEVVSFMKFPL